MGIPPLQRPTCRVEKNGEELTSQRARQCRRMLAAVHAYGTTALGDVQVTDVESVLTGVTQLVRCEGMAARWSKSKSPRSSVLACETFEISQI